MTRSISLLLVGLLVTAVLAVEPGEVKRIPASDECAADDAAAQAELHRLPSVLVAKTTARRSPGVEALLQAVPNGPSAAPSAAPARNTATQAEAVESERVAVRTPSATKPALASAPLPGEPDDLEVVVTDPVAAGRVAAVPAPAAKPAPLPALVEAPARIAPVTAEAAAQSHLLAAAPPVMVQPVAMPMPQSTCASAAPPASCSTCATCDACSQCDSGHYREGCIGHLHRKCHENAGCPDLFCEPPLGWSVNAAANAQINKGLADQTILYQYDFLTGDHAAELSVRGRYQLEKIANLMLDTGLSPLVIESTLTNARLDEARRATVLRDLKALNSAFPDAAVVVARPRTHGLRGDEAILMDQNNLQNTQLRGGLLPAIDNTNNSTQSQ